MKSSKNHKFSGDYREKEVYKFAYMRLILEVKFGDDPYVRTESKHL